MPELSSRIRSIRSDLEIRQPAMARVLGISQRKLSELENDARDIRLETRRRLTEIERLHKALLDLVDPSELRGWLERPNPAFEGATPLQLIERGEIDRLWEMIHLVRAGHPF